MTARHLSLTLSVLLVSTSFAETDLTPERAIALALEKNAAMAVAGARGDVAEGLRTQAGLKPNLGSSFNRKMRGLRCPCRFASRRTRTPLAICRKSSRRGKTAAPGRCRVRKRPRRRLVARVPSRRRRRPSPLCLLDRDRRATACSRPDRYVESPGADSTISPRTGSAKDSRRQTLFACN